LSLVQIKGKWIKARPSPPKPGQIFAKKKALISLDWLRRFEPFQRVIVTPRGKEFSSLPFSALAFRNRELRLAISSIYPGFLIFARKCRYSVNPAPLKAIPSRRVML
jgi:hypothetical protein